MAALAAGESKPLTKGKRRKGLYYDLDVEDWIARAGVDRPRDRNAEVWRQEGVARRRRKALVQRAMGDPRGDEAILVAAGSGNWHVVFMIAAAMDPSAAVLALVVLRPMRFRLMETAARSLSRSRRMT